MLDSDATRESQRRATARRTRMRDGVETEAEQKAETTQSRDETQNRDETQSRDETHSRDET